MSARGALLAYLRQAGLSTRRAEANVDAYAHELAEEQRRAIEGFDLDDHWAVFYRASDVESLPDLIDPTKENDG